MSKSIKIDDETYKLVTKFAKQEDRPLSNALARLVKIGLTNSGSGPMLDTTVDSVKDKEDEEDKPWLIQKSERQVFTKEDSHSVTIPSVDTSQPRDSITPHKRWVPTTPEELEAELEKVRRGEREP